MSFKEFELPEDFELEQDDIEEGVEEEDDDDDDEEEEEEVETSEGINW